MLRQLTLTIDGRITAVRQVSSLCGLDLAELENRLSFLHHLTTESKPDKLEICCTVILHPTVSVVLWLWGLACRQDTW